MFYQFTNLLFQVMAAEAAVVVATVPALSTFTSSRTTEAEEETGCWVCCRCWHW